MILGIGSDLIDIRRIERVLETYGDRFVSRIFTEEEQRRSERRANRAASYAKRYAAKEACAKALGTGFRAGVVTAPRTRVAAYTEDQRTVVTRTGTPDRGASTIFPSPTYMATWCTSVQAAL